MRVNERNEVIGWDTRRATVRARALGRGSFGIVRRMDVDDDGRGDDGGDEGGRGSVGGILVTKRSEGKDVWPGRYDVVTSGVCATRDGTGGGLSTAAAAYEETMRRELGEELGADAAKDARVRKLFEFPYEDAYMRVWGACFEIVLRNGAVVAFEDGEVASGEFVKLDEIEERLKREPGVFTPVGAYVLSRYLEFVRDGGKTPPQTWNERYIDESAEKN